MSAVPDLVSLFHRLTTKWLDTDDAGRHCGYANGDPLREHRKHGTGPRYSRINTHTVRYSTADLDQWLASFAVEPRTAGGR